MSTIQYPPGTAGQRLGITRTISKTIGRVPWTFGYDNDGRLVTMMPADEYETRVLEKRGKPEECAALEFQYMFQTDPADNTLVPDDDWLAGPSDPIGKLIRKFQDDALDKTAGGVNDCLWSSPMVTPVEEVYEQAGVSALSAMKKFLRSNAQSLGTEQLDCSALRKSFREEKCQRQ